MLLWPLLLSLLIAYGFWQHRFEWREAQGFEPEQIARSLASGHGYSFDPEHRWLFQGPADTTYGPTAWEEPVYPLVLAGAFAVVPAPQAKLAIVWGQAALLLATAILLYNLGSRYFGRGTGILASFLLVIQPHVLHLALGTLSAATATGFIVMLSATMILWSLERATLGSAASLGGVLGLAALTGSATLPFIPLAALLTYVRRHRLRLSGVPAVALLLLAFGAVLGPWILRNERVFGMFIPTRTGLGQIMHVGNPVLAETFVPGLSACPGKPTPPWRVKGAGAAIERSRAHTPRAQLEHRSTACIREVAPPDYARMNEAQRDRLYFSEALRFVRAHPRIAGTLAARKEFAFFYEGLKWYLRLIAVLAALGALFAVRRPAARILVVMVLGYSIPYVIGVPYFDRYRYPIEPLLLLFAGCALLEIVQLGAGMVGLQTAPAEVESVLPSPVLTR